MIPPHAAREQLERILKSEAFARADQTSRFLRFTVEAVIEGRSSEVKESVLGLEVFGRGPDFDPRLDPIVRVTARTLRQKLDDYYRNGGHADPLIIELPKGTYVPMIRQPEKTETRSPEVASSLPRWRPKAWTAAIGAGALVLSSAVFAWQQQVDARIDPIRFTRFASDPGADLYPAFSPDGRFVAYLRDLGVKSEFVAVSLKTNTRVALANSSISLGPKDTPVYGVWPVWTADGTRVCYATGTGDLWCVGAAGGSPQLFMKDVTGPQFTPDSKSLIFLRSKNGKPGLFISSPPGSSPKPLESVEMPRTPGNFLLLSPDGAKLLFGRIAGPPLGVSIASFPSGKSREIQSEKGWVAVGPAAWFPDSRHLALVERSADRDYAYRVVIADTESDARRLVVADIGIVSSVAVGADGKEILYSTSGGRDGIDVVEHAIDGARVRVVAQEAFEPSWSRLDGSFVYEVGANGQPSTLWRGADGAEPKLLMTDRPQASRFSYSPDGLRLAYNMGVLGVTPGIETISAKGGQPVRVLSTNVRVGSPCWSPDGNWLIYGQAGKLFKIASQGGGEPTLIKERAEQRLICSPRGDSIAYFSGGQAHVMTWDGQQDRAIGSARDYVPPGTFIEEGKSLLVVRRPDQASADVIDVATGRVRRTIHFEMPPTDTIMGLSVHPNGKRVLIASGQPPYDLWKAEGFARPATGWRRWLQHWEHSN